MSLGNMSVVVGLKKSSRLTTVARQTTRSYWWGHDTLGRILVFMFLKNSPLLRILNSNSVILLTLTESNRHYFFLG